MTEIFIGRQPIFDRNLEIQAYELLYRQTGTSNSANVTDGNLSTSNVLVNSLVELGIESLVGEHRAFVNITQYFLENPELIVFAPGKVVLEILETVEVNARVVRGLIELKKKGHIVALDDFGFQEHLLPMLNFADIVKIDVLAMDRTEVEQRVGELRTRGVRLLAEKVESHAQFEHLKELGFDYFQGYFFAKPKIVQGRAVPLNKLSVLQLLARINSPDVDMGELAKLIRTDVSLSHKILRFINSPMSGICQKVDSIERAVILLGLRKLKNWASIFEMAAQIGIPFVLPITSLTRARFCELLAESNQLPEPDVFFTVGLFSVLDAIMGFPLNELIKELPLSDPIRNALIGNLGPCGEALKCAQLMESNEFNQLRFYDSDLLDLSRLHLEAIRWADDISAYCY